MLFRSKGERQVAPEVGPEERAEADGDERAVGTAARAGPRPGGRRYNQPGPSAGNRLAAADKVVSAPKRPEAPGTKF